MMRNKRKRAALERAEGGQLVNDHTLAFAGEH